MKYLGLTILGIACLGSGWSVSNCYVGAALSLIGGFILGRVSYVASRRDKDERG